MDKKNAIRFLRRYTVRDKGPVDPERFKEAMAALHDSAIEHGLDDSEIDVCIAFLVKPFVRVNMKKSVLQCLFPVTVVPVSATKKLLCWIFTEYHKSASPIVLALQWLCGLIEFGLTDPAMIDGFYPLYFHLVRFHKYERGACKLIYLLTRPEDVRRHRVEEILKLQKERGLQRYITALLSLFKAYRPEYVPEKVPAMSVTTAFGRVPLKLLEGFQVASARKEASGLLNPWLEEAKWKAVDFEKVKGGKLIPAISYIHFESAQYRSDENRCILDFRTIEELSGYQLTLDVPCNVMSLLATPEGCHIIAFADDAVQARFSFSLFYTLHNVFLMQERRVSELEMKDFLQRIWELEQYMLQGIPVVSRFLAAYMNMWDGESFFKEILQLLEWVTYDSFSELNECILIHLMTYYRVAFIKKKCAIIKMLGKMLRNLLIVRLHRVNKGVTSAFIGEWDLKDSVEAAQSLSQFITDLCTMGLLHTTVHSVSHIELLDEAVCFYEMILQVEIMSGLPVWTVLPPIVLYKCFFSRNAVLINRICALLLRYRQKMKPHLKSLGCLGEFEDVQELLNLYVIDLGNCMWSAKAFTHADSGYIFKDLETRKLRTFLNYFNMDFAFTILSHIALAPYVKDYVVEKSRARTGMNRSEALRIIGEEFPSIRELVEVYVERQLTPSLSDE